MDTTPEYIKMCEKAEEIQKTWNPLDGDLHILVDDSYKSGYSDIRLTYGITSLREERKVAWLTRSSSTLGVIWLPRQDQLQEMMKDGLSTGIFGHTSRMVCYFEEHYKYRNSLGIDNMEQLWLAFVMKELYSKQWNGSEWVPL